MEELDLEIRDARTRVRALIEITRWIWLINVIVMVIGLVYSRFDVAGLAAFTWVMALLAAATGRRIARYLGDAHRTIHSL